jgi:hypothetical protein
MITQLTPPNPPAVTVADGMVHITELVETDPLVVDALANADDPEAATHALLRIGGQAVRIAAADLDTEFIERRIETMTGAFDTTVTKAVTLVADTAEHLLDADNGALPAAIGEFRTNLAQLLGDTFDPDSKTSAIAKIEGVVDTATEQLLRAVKGTFSLDEPDSPLARAKRETVDVIKDEVAAVLTELRDLGKTLAANVAVAAVADKLTAKGVGFEELIIAHLTFSSVHGDIVEAVGRTAGAGGTRKGDVCVTVCADDTAGRGGRFVLEAKDQKLSMTKTLAELDAAIANHDAAAAVAVFAGPHLAPIATPFWYSGNRAVVVFDKTDPDPNVLQLAYEWARWVARRSVADPGAALDLPRVQAGIDRVRLALTRHQAIKACHSAIKNKADEARGHVADLVGEVDQAMDDLRAVIGTADAAA